jgi:hypothetical protein
VLHPPAAPASITVPATSGPSLTASWAAASTASSYTLQQQLNGGAWSTLFSGNVTSKAVTETVSGSYLFRIAACNDGGCSGYRTSSAVVVTAPVSTAPSLSVPSTSSTGSYTVSWGSVSGATSYTLQEQVNSGGWSTVYAGTGRPKTFSGKSNGAHYGYHVRACDALGCGPFSAVKTVTIGIPPPVPTNVVEVEKIGYKLTTYTVNWNAVAGATGYQVKFDNSTTYVNVGTDTTYGAGSAFTPDLPPEHVVYVRSCNAYACSAWVRAQWSDSL